MTFVRTIQAQVLFVLILGTTQVMAQPRFYLSTKKIFNPTEKVSVELESRGVSDLELRVYQLQDPEKFLLNLSDPHRPYVKTSKRRLGGGKLLRELYRNSLKGIYEPFTQEFTNQARQTLRNLYSDRSYQYRKTIHAQPQLKVPLLLEYPLIYQEKITTGGPGYQWTYRSIPINVTSEGVYLVEAASKRQTAYTIVVVSDIAVIVKQGPSKLISYVVNQANGQPVENANVYIYSNQKLLNKGNTDKSGILASTVSSHQTFVIVKKDNHLALSDPRFFPSSVEDRKVLIFTERPVYKPGHEVFFKGIARKQKNGKYSIEPNTNVDIEVIAPDSQVIHTTKVQLSSWGSFNGQFTMPESIAMGIYRIVATIKGQKYAGEFKIKHFVKPEYKVSVDLEKETYQEGQKVSGVIKGQYYSGGVLANAKVTYEVYRTRFYIPWWLDAEYSWYYSDSEIRSTIKEKVTDGKGELDSNGQLSFSFQLDSKGADHTYEIVAEVTNEAGRPIRGQQSFQVTVGSLYLKIVTDKIVYKPHTNATIIVTANSYDHHGINEQPIQLIMHGIDGQGNHTEITQQQTSTTEHGQASFTIAIPQSGYYSLTATTNDLDGSQVKAVQNLFSSDGEASLNYLSQRLMVIPHKKTYHVGDLAQILIITPQSEGAVLVTTEGRKLYDFQAIPIHNYTALYTYKITNQQTPNFFISANCISNGKLYSETRSIIAPPAHRFLNIDISSNKQVYKPRDEATITVKVTDHKGKPVQAELALGVVDASIYAISPKLVADIKHFFYHKLRNNIRTHSSFSFRFYGYSRESEMQWAGIIKDPFSFGSNKQLSQKMRKVFKDTAFWDSHIHTNAQGLATITFTLPDNLTQWRASIWAFTKNMAVGETTTHFRVQKDLELRVAGLSFATEHDQPVIRLLAHNNTSKEQTISFSLDAQGATIQPSPNKEVTIAAKSSAFKDYSLTITSETMLVLQASAKGSLSDAIEIRKPIKPYGVRHLLSNAGHLPSASSDISINLKFPENQAVDLTNAQLDLRVESSLAQTMVAALDYLTTYPYGCVEQTMNGFLPDVVAHQALKDLGIKHPQLTKRLDEYVLAGIHRLKQLQNNDGSWGWWGHNERNTYMTAHVVYGLALAQKTGVTIPDDMLKRGTSRLQYLLRRETDKTTLAYGLYALSISGLKNKSQINKLFKQKQDLTPYGLALVSLTLQELGQQQKSKATTQNLIQQAAYDPDQDVAYWGTQPHSFYNWREDPIETTAFVIKALLHSAPENERVQQAINWLVQQRQNNHWQSTRDTAAVVYMLVDYFKRIKPKQPKTIVAAGINGTYLGSGTITPETMFQQSPLIFTATTKELKQPENLLHVSKQTGGDMFYSATLSYWGREKDIEPGGDIFKVRRQYKALSYNEQGKGYESEGISESIKTGSMYMVEISIEPTHQDKSLYEYVMLEDMLPAGVEVFEQDSGILVDGELVVQRGIHREIKYDRISFFLTELPKPVRVRYLIRPIRSGTYNALPAHASLMYYPHHRGYSSNDILTIIQGE